MRKEKYINDHLDLEILLHVSSAFTVTFTNFIFWSLYKFFTEKCLTFFISDNKQTKCHLPVILKLLEFEHHLLYFPYVL